MLNKQEQSNIVKGNGGFSLIETIVGLLILAIIVAPLLNSFVFNAKTNVRSARQQEATSVATGIMEEIKAGGIVKWAEAKGWDISKGPLDFQQSEKSFQFDVEVICEPVSRATQGEIMWNNYEMPDISKLNRKTTAIIDPFELFVTYEGAADSQNAKLIDTYDDMAAAEFRNNHLEEIYDRWSEYVSDLEDEDEVPPAPEAYSVEDIKKKMSREMILTVDNNKAEGEERTVSAVIKYILYCNVEYHYGTNIDELPYGKPWAPETHDRVYNGFYDKVKFDSLKDIYLFHTPLKGSVDSWRGRDKIILEDNSGKSGVKGRLFIAPQLYNLNMDVPCTVEIEPKESWEVYYLSDNPSFEEKNKYLLGGQRKIPAYGMEDISVKTKENQLAEKLQAENRLYNIRVSVKIKGGNKELISLESEGK